MTKSIRWTPEQLEEYKLRGKMPKPAPVASDPREHRWSDDELAAMGTKVVPPLQVNRTKAAAPPPAPEKKPSKYRSRKVDVDGIVHDSSKEARRWAVLQAQAAAGEIVDLKRQQSFVLAPSVRLTGEDRKKPALRYFADFTYMRDGQMVVEDTKSKPTRKLAAYRIKRHLMKTVLNLDITEV